LGLSREHLLGELATSHVQVVAARASATIAIILARSLSRTRAGRAVLALLTLTALTCGFATLPGQAQPAAADSVPERAEGAPVDPTRRDFAGLVDIGTGRKLYLECRGRGSTTVVLVPGGMEGGWMWTYVLSRGGASTGRSLPHKADSAVFQTVAAFTRVCLYDRPNTVVGHDIVDKRAGAVSTPVPQPHPLDDDVADLHLLLTVADEAGPYVLVGHSLGGMIAELFARRYPHEVAGEVLVDAASVYYRETFSSDAYDRLVTGLRLPWVEGGEALDFANAINVVLAAPPGPQVPAVVLASDKAPEGFSASDMAELRAAQARLAAQLGAKFVANTDSGHFVHVEQPRLVIDAIREVLDAVHSGVNRLAP
jgi:pimeloyl-ACP methyl ester carboxylesterase